MKACEAVLLNGLGITRHIMGISSRRYTMTSGLASAFDPNARHSRFIGDRLKRWILCDDETTSKIRPMTNIPGQDERSSEMTPVPVVDDDMDDVLLMK